MQNDELRRAYLAVDESGDCYVGFYDMFPVGHLKYYGGGFDCWNQSYCCEIA